MIKNILKSLVLLIILILVSPAIPLILSLFWFYVLEDERSHTIQIKKYAEHLDGEYLNCFDESEKERMHTFKDRGKTK